MTRLLLALVMWLRSSASGECLAGVSQVSLEDELRGPGPAHVRARARRTRGNEIDASLGHVCAWSGRIAEGVSCLQQAVTDYESISAPSVC